MDKMPIYQHDVKVKGETSKMKPAPDYFKRPTNPTPKNK
ncbi:hypothetical protein Javan143_0005 [Streptococcus phage Javan143]|nr:hypothetical protein Javan143_0005 [Streptococcus phage Javan143]UNI71037.1 hypothetical protein [Streptococcus phage phiAp1.1-Spec]CKG89082.1 Uncharacterised protein [Streptococcus pyogenes]SUO50723.1 Uncharacterised protein [Streptococcus pyogenes]SUO54834.1 Uncharacterised protein [Streptococcus pyogenes]